MLCETLWPLSNVKRKFRTMSPTAIFVEVSTVCWKLVSRTDRVKMQSLELRLGNLRGPQNCLSRPSAHSEWATESGVEMEESTLDLHCQFSNVPFMTPRTPQRFYCLDHEANSHLLMAGITLLISIPWYPQLSRS
jgi:hypothetical protein